MVAAEHSPKRTSPAEPIEIREIDGQLYASSPNQGWYALSLGDDKHLPRCECPHHRKRLLGTKTPCKHLKAGQRYLARKGWELVSGNERRQERPDPDWVRAACPVCGEPVVSNAYYVGGKGYVIVWTCWESLGEHPTCDYWRTL